MAGVSIDLEAIPPSDGLVPHDQRSSECHRLEGLWSGRTLAAELDRTAGRHWERQALVASEVAWTCRELCKRARAFARGLRGGVGVRAGDAAMFQMGNIAATVCRVSGQCAHPGATGLHTPSARHQGGLPTSRAHRSAAAVDSGSSLLDRIAPHPWLQGKRLLSSKLSYLTTDSLHPYND